MEYIWDNTQHIAVTHQMVDAVVASEKGVVVGRLTYREDGDLIDCQRMGVGGKAIPPNVDKVTTQSPPASLSDQCMVVYSHPTERTLHSKVTASSFSLPNSKPFPNRKMITFLVAAMHTYHSVQLMCSLL